MARHTAKDGTPCPYCTREMILNDLKLKPTADHIRPKSKDNLLKGLSNRSGASRSRGRIIVVCSECNFMKSDLTLTEFLTLLQAKNKFLLEAIATNTERIENISYLLQIGLDKE
jgi:hypothetical protein